MALDTLESTAYDRQIPFGQPGYRLPAQAAAGATVEEFVWRDQRASLLGNVGPAKVNAVNVTATAAITGQATNYVTINIRKYSAAGGALGTGTVVATLSFLAGTNVAAGATIAVPVTAANATLNPGDRLSVQLVQTGTGLAFPQSLLDIDVRQD